MKKLVLNIDGTNKLADWIKYVEKENDNQDIQKSGDLPEGAKWIDNNEEEIEIAGTKADNDPLEPKVEAARKDNYLDRHLNVFNAYAQGKYGDAYREKVLEDNVTRALIATLHHVPFLSEFLISKLLEFTPAGTCEYALQQRLKRDGVGDIETRIKKRRMFVLCIARKNHAPSVQVPEGLIARVEPLIMEGHDQKERLRAILGRCLERDEDGEPISGSRLLSEVSRLASLLKVFAADVERLDQDTLRYLYDLTWGSRPDALVISKAPAAAILLENKVRGGIAPAQIARHIRENFGDGLSPRYSVYPDPIPLAEPGQVIVRICTWEDIFKLCEAAPSTADRASRFLVRQLLDYLEVNNMGPIKFSRQDFLDWEREWKTGHDRDFTQALKERVIAVSEALSQRIGDHWVNKMKAGENGLICNIVDSKRYPRDKGFRPINVPHISVLLHQAGFEGRGLRLFVQCEGAKPVRNILKNEQALQPELVEAIKGLGPGFVLRVEKKLFVLIGASGKNEAHWDIYWQVPLEAVGEQDTGAVVAQAFRAMRTVEKLPKPPLAGTNLPVLQLTYRLNWQELEHIGDRLEENLWAAYQKMERYYSALREYVAGEQGLPLHEKRASKGAV